MMESARIRYTIVIPEAKIDAANALLGLSVQSAGWCDAEGQRYGAASFLADSRITTENLSALPVVTFSANAPLALLADHVLVIEGTRGPASLGRLGLMALGPENGMH